MQPLSKNVLRIASMMSGTTNSLFLFMNLTQPPRVSRPELWCISNMLEPCIGDTNQQLRSNMTPAPAQNEFFLHSNRTDTKMYKTTSLLLVSGTISYAMVNLRNV